MIKYALIIANMIGALLVGTFMDDGVIIEDNTPSTMAPGEERRIDVTINKGEVEGFAKLQIDVPEGMTATAGETNGASFTFSNQKIKFIWMSLPAEQEFTVNYHLKAAPTASGSKVVSGVFSYIKENQRIDYELQSKIIVVGGTNTDVVSQPTEPSVETAAPAYEGTDLACLRTITEIEADKYLVTLNVVNSDLKGFAKIKENIPSGLTINEDDSDGAVVTIEKDGIKYIWFEVPKLTNFKVSYTLTGTAAPKIEGTFSYVEDNSPKEMDVVNTGTTLIEEPLAAVTEPVAPVVPKDNGAATVAEVKETPKEVKQDPKTEPKTVPSNTTNTKGADKTTNTSTTASVKPSNPTSISVPEPEVGVTYKVQIVAAHRVVGKEYFKSRHNFSENFSIENHEGWVKYATGKWEAYSEARNDRERIKKVYNFNGPFVTAYNDGERITVQEALMLTKQEWIK
ncbi:MAG: hypothetical protein GC193_02370 [Cryomorphaceae bacterium]|nr:hypothetical protein [Cryomorphaceae bacterium]